MLKERDSHHLKFLTIFQIKTKKNKEIQYFDKLFWGEECAVNIPQSSTSAIIIK